MLFEWVLVDSLVLQNPPERKAQTIGSEKLRGGCR